MQNSLPQHLLNLEAKLERFVRVGEFVANGVWWLWLGGLAVGAYANRETLDWRDVQFAAVATAVLLVVLFVGLALLFGCLHAWKLSILLGMLGGFIGQAWGSIACLCLAGFLGLILLFFDAQPLRDARRRR